MFTPVPAGFTAFHTDGPTGRASIGTEEGRRRLAATDTAIGTELA